MTRRLTRSLRNDATSRLSRIMLEVEDKFRLKRTMVGDTGELRQELLSEFLSRASEFSSQQIIDWLESTGTQINYSPGTDIEGVGKVNGKRILNPDGTWDRDVPGVGKIRFGEPKDKALVDLVRSKVN